MAFEKYFVELIKQTGPSQQEKVLVPVGPSFSFETGEIQPSVRTADIADGEVTPAKTNVVEARTATADGLTTGIVSDTSSHVTVSSGNATHIITLPSPTPGRIVVLHVGANGYELKTTAPATIAINGGAGSNFSSAIAADSTVIAICVSATAWKAFFLDADSDVAKVPAAD